MKGYKVLDCDYKGFYGDFQYKVGEAYKHEGEIKLCESGFHFCEKLEDCFNYADAVTWNKIVEVEALGEIIKSDDKCVTDKIKIIKEIKWSDIADINLILLQKIFVVGCITSACLVIGGRCLKGALVHDGAGRFGHLQRGIYLAHQPASMAGHQGVQRVRKGADGGKARSFL